MKQSKMGKDFSQHLRSKMKILEAPVLGSRKLSVLAVFERRDECSRFLQNIFNLRIIDAFDMFIIRKIFLITFMLHDLETSCVECVLVF
jgi:hypothetical protein